MKLVGISGCTNGGKSTLARMLTAHYPNSVHICQDTFFYTRESGKLEYVPSAGSHNFDTISAIDVERFSQSLDELMNHEPKYDYIFIDGFLVFMLKESEFMQKLAAKFFLTLSKEECLRRRSKRVFKTVGSPEYFEQLVWPCYQNYLKFCQSNYNDICYFDADAEGSVDLAFELAIKTIDSIKGWFSPMKFLPKEKQSFQRSFPLLQPHSSVYPNRLRTE